MPRIDSITMGRSGMNPTSTAEFSGWIKQPLVTVVKQDGRNIETLARPVSIGALWGQGRYRAGVRAAFEAANSFASLPENAGKTVAIVQARSGAVSLTHLVDKEWTYDLDGKPDPAWFDLASAGPIGRSTFINPSRSLLGLAGNGQVVRFTPTGRAHVAPAVAPAG